MAGGCSAVGEDQRRGVGGPQALTWERSSNTWSVGSRLSLPGGAPPTDVSVLSDVSCSYSQTCAAVGGYARGPSVALTPMVTREVHGVFSQAVALPVPKGYAPTSSSGGTGSSQLVWCQYLPISRCIVVGGLTKPGHGAVGEFSAMLALDATWSGWRSATAVIPSALPSGIGTNTHEQINSISCADVIDCLMVGSLNATHDPGLPITQVERHGVWGPIHVAPLPSDFASADLTGPEGTLTSVSCPDSQRPLVAMSCVAVGWYHSVAGPLKPLVETFASMAWSVGTAPSMPVYELQSVYCEAFHTVFCVATGIASGLSGGTVEFVAHGTPSGFAVASKVADFPVATPPGSARWLTSIACPSISYSCISTGMEVVGSGIDAVVVPVDGRAIA